jgi:hypothetical protein
MRKVVSFIVLVLLTTAILVACTPPPTDVSGQFNVNNGIITDPNGNTFNPIGANVGTLGSFDWAGDARGQSAAAQQWGWNIIRLNLYTNDYFTSPGTAKSRAQDIINEYTAKHIVVILASGWMCDVNNGGVSGPGFNNPTTPQNCPQPLAWMRDMAAANNTNPYVWFNCYNEPIADGSAWINLQKACIDAVRGVWNNNLIVIDAPGAADAAWSGAKRMYDPSMGPVLTAYNRRLVFSNHNYDAFPTCSNSEVADYIDRMHAAQLAIIFGEFGDFSPGSLPKYHACAVANIAVGPGRHAGVVIWHGTMADGFWLRQGTAFYGNGPLTDLGQRLWNLTH